MTGGATQSRECSLLGMSGGWSPVVHLTSHTGIKPRYDEAIAAFVPGGFAPGHFGAGALQGRFDLAAAIRRGFEAGAAAAAACRPGKTRRRDAPEGVDQTPSADAHAIEPVWQVPNLPKGKAFVDFQNDVTMKDVALAHQEGYHSVEHLKRYTTLGMGTDQGKTSNINALAIMAGLRGVAIPEAGTTTFRPPYGPSPWARSPAAAIGHHFRPARLSPLHDWHVPTAPPYRGGPVDARLVYPLGRAIAGDGLCRGDELVRRGVGIADVSTLGKIDVQGPDAAEFLNRVYVNGFAKLPVGKARYGVMLNDDGIVLDDGTTTRFPRHAIS